ncbi:MAG: hypothetical protein J6X53_00145 [Abditibacteriota bacterium]|nr:hypothetical protein [Abditibacteriota bacterium]
MKKYRLVCSIDAIDIDYETEIVSDVEPGFWDCYEIAEEHGCSFWDLWEAAA